MNEESQFREWLEALLEGEATPEEQWALAELCRGNERYAEELREALAFDSLLHDALCEASSAEKARQGFCDAVEARLAGLTKAGAEPERGGLDRDDRFDELLSKLVDRDLEVGDLELLEQSLDADLDRVDRLRQSLSLDDLLSQALNPARNVERFEEALVTRTWAESEDDSFVDALAPKIFALAGDESGGGEGSEDASRVGDKVTAFPSPVRTEARAIEIGPRQRMPWIPITVAAAAAAVLTLLVTRFLFPTPEGPVSPSFATVTSYSPDVRWAAVGETTGAPASSGELHAGRYQLESGVVRVRFASGSEMTVEGPAEFEVRSGNEVFVHSGIAVARAERPGSLRMGSPGLEVADAGRSFAVDARFDSFTEAVMFDGGGQLKIEGGKASRDLFPFEAVRADFGRDKLLDIPYNPRVFERGWELLSGVESVGGEVKLELPGVVRPPRKRDAEKVQVFLERDGFSAEEPLVADTLETGQFVSLANAMPDEIRSKYALRSYLLQRVAGENDRSTLEASLTFDHPVVGVIFTKEGLENTDALVGARFEDFDEPATLSRGLDAKGERSNGDEEDRILLSEDRRTVNLVLHGGAGDALDHVRVLVELPGQPAT